MATLLDTFEDDFDYALPGERPARARWKLRKPKADKFKIRSTLEERATAGATPTQLALSPNLDASNEEKAYLLEQLAPFCGGKFITAVVRRVKGGKEANVYCCAAHPATGQTFLAAKVYRARQFRNLKNDAVYRQGRAVLNGDGEAISQRDWRAFKAIASKSRYGLRVTQTSWVEYEYQALQKLYAAGADVPRVFHNGAHVLLMEYLGELTRAAPTLHRVDLPPKTAPALFERLIHNATIILQQGYVHGDLSAYNVLYWEGAVKVIDFPQVVEARHNPDARRMFERDLTRLCDYFARYGVRANPARLARDLWQQHGPPPPTDEA
jgi:RIO kinase 1